MPELLDPVYPVRLPLSFSQQRLWFVQQLEGPSPTYNIPFALRLEGAVDADALEAALRDLLERHESLRTVFDQHDGVPTQVVLSPAAVSLQLVLITTNEQELSAELCRATKSSFDLSRDVPLRPHLFKVGETQYVLLLLIHHIAGDGGSWAPLTRDLFQAYTERCQDRKPQWAPLAVQYADYTLWQQQWLGQESDPNSAIAAQITYWKQALAGLPEQLNLPADRVRPASQSYRGEGVAFHIDGSTHQQLVSLARASQASLFMVLHAGLVLLLSRLGAGSDIPVGTSTAGRTDEALEDLIGFFVNTLVLRVDTGGNPSFRELLTRVRAADLAAYTHQDLPFEKLVELLNPARSAAYHPLVQVSLGLQAGTRADLNIPGLRITAQAVDSFVARFDLSFRFAEQHTSDGTPAGISGMVTFACDLFDRATVEGFAARFVRLIESVGRDPQQHIEQIDLLDAQERQRWLRDCNDTRQPLPPGLIHQWFEQCAALTPEAIALVSEGQSISYAQLDAQANQLAHFLQSLGVAPDMLVGLCLPRSPHLLVAVLGILKAGAAYLPLDPAYPAERLAYLLNDSFAAVLLTLATSSGQLPSHRVRLVQLDTQADLIRSFPHTPPPCAVRPDQLAYTIYTSGSTGQPKGVAVQHLNLCASTAARIAYYGSPGSILLLPSVAFDSSVATLFWALCTGATLVLPTEGLERDPRHLAQLIQQQQIRAWLSVPSLYEATLELQPDQLHSLRTLVLAGEALPGTLLSKLRHCQPQCALFNEYGPTEATVWACVARLDSASASSQRPSIGSPIANTQVYVLDEWLQPAPPGVPGELYIAGLGLARGYLNRAALSAERFIAHPFGEPGARLYRTGDRVRWRADGQLDFLGRTDSQIKIRGFRIELGEIEALLLQQPGVAQAAVIAREDSPGMLQLVGYVVPAAQAARPSEAAAAQAGQSGPAALDTAHLRQSLARQLPEHMLPAALVVLAALPLTPNGKLDRKALPAPDFSSHSARAPRTPQEEILANLFIEVLGLQRIGIDDNFFELGGHSLLVTRLVSRIRSTLEVELAIRDVFESPTVAELAQQLAQGGGSAARTPLMRMERPAYIPLSFAQQRLWFLHQFEGPSPTYNVPQALRLEGVLDTPALTAAFADLLSRHESLRTVFGETDGIGHQIIVPENEAKVVTQSVRVRAEELPGALKQAAGYCFELAHEIPIRAWIFELDADKHVLLLLVHHISSDGWSWAQIARELSQAYASRRQNRAPQWTPPAVQYADYTLWQRKWLGQESDPDSPIARQIAYWKETLADLPEQLTLPTDRPRLARPSYRGDRVEFQFAPDTHRGLLELARNDQASLFMVLHAALATLLSRLGAGSDIPLGTPIAGRTDEALDELVGFFVNTLVLRANTTGNPTFRELLARVRTHDLAAYSNQDLPFERLVEILNPVRSTAHHPLFQIWLVLENDASPAPALSGLTVAPQPLAPLGVCVARFDLAFSFTQHRAPDGSPAQLTGIIKFACDVFDRPTVQTIAERLVRLLEAIARNPEQRINQIDLLSRPERQRLLTDWNATAHEVAVQTLPPLFELQAARVPQAIALLHEHGCLSYAQLNSRANQLARWLISQGIGPEQIVAFALPRSVEMIVALLATLKCGAAYLPLDIDYPPERLALMLEDSGAVCTLTRHECVSRLPAAARRQCLDDPALSKALAALSDTDLTNTERLRAVHPDHPAYLIYTSGSTGRPKGVLVPHRSIANYLTWDTQTHYPGATSPHGDPAAPDESPTHGGSPTVFSISFDAGITTLLGALMAGQALRLLPCGSEVQALSSGPPLPADPYTLVKVTPSHLKLINQSLQLDPAAPSPTRTLMTGGEAAVPADMAFWQQRFPGVRLVNHFGPTETTVGCATYEIQQDVSARHSIPIGRPLWNTQLYVLDESLQPVPTGVAGELYVAGAGLARGYLKRAALTAQRFIANPFGAPGTRLYRTGDLVRWLPEGVLDYLGRTDSQVKIRGFRIELGEIEALLLQQPGVAQAAVTAREDSPGMLQLVGYVVPAAQASGPAAAAQAGQAGPAALDTARLRQSLAEQLPEHMLPAALVVLAALPLTPNGKLDRKALPAPDFSSHSARTPRTPQEEILANLFIEVLGLQRIGIDDNFFELGGHSLLVTRLVSRIRSTLAVELPIRAPFEAPTVATLAEKVAAAPKARPRLQRMTQHGPKHEQ